MSRVTLAELWLFFASSFFTKSVDCIHTEMYGIAAFLFLVSVFYCWLWRRERKQKPIESTGLHLAIGGYNIAIGFKAGANISTGSRNILIGDDIQTPTPQTSNYINILGLIEIENFGREGMKTTIHDRQATQFFGQNLLIGNFSWAMTR